MTAPLSLPLRISLISLVFAALVAAVLTALGGSLLHLQQRENAVNRAKLVADELTVRAGKLLAMELPLADFIGFDEQCSAVIRNDPVLSGASLYDAARQERFRSSGAAPRPWPLGPQTPEGDRLHVAGSDGGPLVLRPVQGRANGVEGYALVAVNGDAVLRQTLGHVAALAGSALALFVLGLFIQQWVFWRTVGIPLGELVRTADQIRPEQPESLQRLQATDGPAAAGDDIGRVHAAFNRLVQRLLAAQGQLVQANEHLEATVQQRTAQLEQANAELARDIKRRQQLEDQLRALASTDVLTGLANRAFILPFAKQHLESARAEGRTLGLMVMDFDGFKAINDTHGHAVGDEVLRVMGRRLAANCRASERVARLGGDEFLLVFEWFGSASEVQGLVRRLTALFEDPIPVGDLRLRMGVSLGAAWYPDHAQDLDTLLAAADAAMYAAKHQGGGCVIAGLSGRPAPVSDPTPPATASPVQTSR